MILTVEMAGMKISSEPGDTLLTHAVGSCLGIAAHDPVALIGGLLHVTMPQAKFDPEQAEANPYMFVDSGVPRFFQLLYSAGACRARLRVKVAGGATVRTDGHDPLNLGRRNIVMLRKLFWKNNILLAGEDVGGAALRAMHLDVRTGRVWLWTQGREIEL